MGAAWASALGVTLVVAFATLAGVLSHVISDTGVQPEGLVLTGAALGAVACAIQLRTRTWLFLRREGVWAIRESWNLRPGAWTAITEDDPVRMEREPLAALEGFTLHVGRRRLLSFLGDPSVARGVARLFRHVGIPLAVTVKAGDGGDRA
jgi:hypothetical protein